MKQVNFEYDLDINLINKQINKFFYLFIICALTLFYTLYKYDKFLYNDLIFYYSLWIITQYSLLKNASDFTTLYSLLKKEPKEEMESKIKKLNYSKILNIINGFYLNFFILIITFLSILFYLLKNNYMKDSFINALIVLPFSVSATTLFISSWSEKIIKKRKVE